MLMAWFRTNRGIAAWLAFFALACQLSLSFGHIHLNKFEVGAFGAAGQAAVETTDQGGAPLPAQPKVPTATDFCAVCANISLVSALILPVLAFILAPRSFTHVFRWSIAAPALVSYRHRPFSARGPPHA